MNYILYKILNGNRTKVKKFKNMDLKQVVKELHNEFDGFVLTSNSLDAGKHYITSKYSDEKYLLVRQN